MIQKTIAFGIFLPLLMLSAGYGIGTYANEKAGGKTEVESTTSRNPLTGTTTTVVKRKYKRTKKTPSGNVNVTDTETLKRKTSRDGTKSSVTDESKYQENTK